MVVWVLPPLAEPPWVKNRSSGEDAATKRQRNQRGRGQERAEGTRTSGPDITREAAGKRGVLRRVEDALSQAVIWQRGWERAEEQFVAFVVVEERLAAVAALDVRAHIRARLRVKGVIEIGAQITLDPLACHGLPPPACSSDL